MRNRDQYRSVGADNRTLRTFGKTIAIFVMVLCCFVVKPTMLCAQMSAEEERIQAAFVWQFIQFIEWPVGTAEQTFTVGIIGTGGIVPFLEEILRQKKLADGRLIEVRRVSNYDDIGKCQTLFICPSENGKTSQILARAKNKPILTIGRNDDFMQIGGLINFFTENSRVRFEINTDEVNSSKLRFSAKLLRLGRPYSKR